MSSGGWTGWSWAWWWSSISFPFFYLVIFLKWVSSNITFPPFGDDVQLNKFSTFFALFCLILPKVGNCVWQIESNTKSIKKLPIFCSKGKVVFDQSNQSKIVLWRLYHVVFDISASKHKISKAFLCKDIWCISWFITGSPFKREMFGMGPEKLMGFVNKYISYCIFCNLLQIWNQNSDWLIRSLLNKINLFFLQKKEKVIVFLWYMGIINDPQDIVAPYYVLGCLIKYSPTRAY